MKPLNAPCVKTLLIATVMVVCFGAIPSMAQQNVSGSWSFVDPLPYFPIHTHLLPTGNVMIWPGDGGVSGNDPRSWDPFDQSVTLLAKPGVDLFCSGHSFLSDGTLFVAGGHIQNSVGLSQASTYDPATDSWTFFPNMNAGRWYPTATVLGNGDVLVVSGDVDTSVGLNTLPQVLQMSAPTPTWRNLTSAELGLELYPPMLLAPNGRVFNPGPSATTRYLDTSGTGAWSVVAERVGGWRSTGSAVMYDSGKVLIMGGGDPPTNTAEVIDLNSAVPTWRQVGSMQFARRQLNATLLPDGQVLVSGGTSAPGFSEPSGAVYAGGTVESVDGDVDHACQRLDSAPLSLGCAAAARWTSHAHGRQWLSGYGDLLAALSLQGHTADHHGGAVEGCIRTDFLRADARCGDDFQGNPAEAFLGDPFVQSKSVH